MGCRPDNSGLTLLSSANRQVLVRDRRRLTPVGSEVPVSCASGTADGAFGRTNTVVIITDFVQRACKIGRVDLTKCLQHYLDCICHRSVHHLFCPPRLGYGPPLLYHTRNNGTVGVLVPFPSKLLTRGAQLLIHPKHDF